MVWLLGHRQPKGAATAKLDLQPPRHISTLPTSRDKGEPGVGPKADGREGADASTKWLIRFALSRSGIFPSRRERLKSTICDAPPRAGALATLLCSTTRRASMIIGMTGLPLAAEWLNSAIRCG